MGRGEVYGKYQLLSKLGSGGMAEVWLARSSSIGGFEKLLAIKRMHPKFSSSERFVSLFIEEAKLSVSLNHPNIVQVFDFGEVDGNYYIAMEFVDGVDLARIATRSRSSSTPLPVGVATYIVRQILESLSYAHGDRKGRSLKIIHRDVSPHNVLVSFDGQVKLSDFGIAKAAVGILPLAESEAVGKTAYMSPEQARGEPVTGATDLWSAGVILHELLANARLFARASDQETQEAVASAAILPPSELNPEVPKELDAITLLLLQRDPAFRPATARLAVESLSEILHRHYPKMDGYSLSDSIGQLWDGPPLALGSPPPALAHPPPAVTPVLERTAFERSSHKKDSWTARPPSTRKSGSAPASEGTPALEPTARRAPLEQPPEDVARQVEQLKHQFQRDPNLWTLFEIGEVYQRAGLSRRALGGLQLAAAKFAQVGLLVQAVAIQCRVRDLTGADDRWRREVSRLPELQHAGDQEVLLEIFGTEDQCADFSDYRALFTRPRAGNEIDIIAPAPILGSLEGEQLVRLVEAVRLVCLPAGATILTEGSSGTSFFWIGRGRVVISARSFHGERVFLNSLADGSCFGEHAFFTGEPRSATVEAVEDVMLLEVSKSSLEEVVRGAKGVAESLRAFYKDRIAEALLARSELFGQLTLPERRELAQSFEFTSAPKGTVLIREGETSDAFYALRSGRVEVVTGAAEGTRLAELEGGQVFGEVAALKGTPRTASVRALADCELLRLEAAQLREFLAKHAHVKELLESQIVNRAEETIQKLEGRLGPTT